MTDAAMISDEQYREKNSDINTIGSGLLWALLALIVPVYYFFLTKRITQIAPWMGAAGGLVLCFIPGVNFIFAIVVLVFIYKRIGAQFIIGHVVLWIVFAILAIGLAVALPAFLGAKEAASAPAVVAPAPMEAAPAEPTPMEAAPAEESSAEGATTEAESGSSEE